MTSPTLMLTEVGHTRTTPLRHQFDYPSCSWLVDLDRLSPSGVPVGIRWWLKPFATFRAADHLGDPDLSWRDNVDRFAASQGVDLSGGRVLALASARTLGHVFNPLSLYWCWDREGELACVIAEVHNTYGDRHAYLVHPNDRGVARTEKSLYVSPFNDAHGRYTMSVPVPDDSLDVTVTLHRPDQRPFVATWRGHRVHGFTDHLRAAVRLPLTNQLVTARIRLQGISLWLRRLPLVPRPTHHTQEAV